MALTVLSGCSTISSKKKSTLNIYQTELIEVEAGTEIETAQGLYKSQTREFWYSQSYVDKLKSLILGK